MQWRGDAIEIERDGVRGVQTTDELVLDDCARADALLVDHELGRRHPDHQSVAVLERGEHSMTGRDRLRAHRTGRGVSMELTHRPGQKEQKLLYRGKVV